MPPREFFAVLKNSVLFVWQAGYFTDRAREFHRIFGRHADAFRRGDPPPVHARAGHRALVLAYAAIGSFESGLRVAVRG